MQVVANRIFLCNTTRYSFSNLTHNIKYAVEISIGKCLIHTDQTTIKSFHRSHLVNPTSIGRSSLKRFISY